MVSFQCDGCSDVIKKPKLDQHRGRCGAPFTCLDCSKTFPTPADYKGHTSCISEAEKYEKSVYQGSPQGNGQGRGGFQQNRGRNQHQSRFGQGGGNYQRGGGVYRATGANGTPLGMSPKIWSHSPPSGEPSSENDMASEKRKHAQEALHMQEDPQPSKRIKLDEPVTVSPTLIIDDALSRIGETNEHKEDKRDKKDKKDKDKKDKRDKKRKGKEPEKDKQWTPSESENASETAVEHDAPELASRRKSKRKDEIAEERKARKEEKKRRKSAAAVDLQGENLSEDDTSTKKKTQHPKRSNEKVVHVELQEPLASSDIEMRDADVEESSNTTTVSVAVESDDRKHQKKQKKERSKEEKKEKKERSKEEKKKEKERSKQEKKERKRAKEVTA